jgi:hypothetical protein
MKRDGGEDGGSRDIKWLGGESWRMMTIMPRISDSDVSDYSIVSVQSV